jgi:pyruvate,orthophosphate dikinase
MTEFLDLCRLEYLIGTLATAYKGLITSLVLKDFCMTETGGSIAVKGTILSMPEGHYRASLIHEGIELSRSEIQNGFFELAAAADDIMRAKNLQIDITQNGRHIGTFLLKREKSDAFFTSALELSDYMKTFDLTLLSSRIKDKPGLLRNAEDIISHIVSRQRDWKKLSEEINSFSKDIFWIDRDTYYRCYDIFVKFSLNAAANLDSTQSAKPVSNFISLIELPLEQEANQEQLSTVIQKWLRALNVSSVDLGFSLEELFGVMRNIHEKFPGTDMAPLLKRITVSVKKRLEKIPFIKDTILNSVRGHLAYDDLSNLLKYSEGRRNEFLGNIAAAEAMLEGREPQETMDRLVRVIQRDLNGTEIVGTFFSTIEAYITKDSGEHLLDALIEFVSSLDMSSPELGRETAAGMARMIKKLASLGMADSCEVLLTNIEKCEFPVRNRVVLDPIVALSILSLGSDTLSSRYSDILQQILIPAPSITGFSNETWAEIATPFHLERLSKFLSVLKLDSQRFTGVLIHVICNLHISDVFIPDDKLFQRDISSYLNTDAMKKNFFLNCILLRKLPVFYNEVAATGRIRDFTTEIDSWGNDVVLYFLRKQTHVNASNYNVLLVEDIIRSWVCDNPDILKSGVPEDVFQKMDRELLKKYSIAIGRLFTSLGIIDEEGLRLDRIIHVSEDDLRKKMRDVIVSEEIRSKIVLICLIYQEIRKKYQMSPEDTDKADIYGNLALFVKELKKLKEAVLSPERTEPQESLYFKRHIAFGIPSVMGSYHEPKFDALGIFFTKQERVRVLLEAVISEIEQKQKTFTESDVSQWFACLQAVHALFDLHELGDFRVDEIMTILRANRLRFSQIIDLLRLWQKELMWMVHNCYRMFHEPLLSVLKKFSPDELPEYLKNLDPHGHDFIHKAADIVIRDLINSVVGFAELDRLIDALVKALRSRVIAGPDDYIVLRDGTDEMKDYYLIGEMSDDSAMQLAPFIGGKAKNLFYLVNKGLTVPSGVVFPSSHTVDYGNYTEGKAFMTSLRAAVKRLEDRTGSVFGESRNPLFLSIRSGSYISMPGILSSILYCGMNESTLGGVIEKTGDPALGWDSYRRFIEHYATVVYGLDPQVFEAIADRFVMSEGIKKLQDLQENGLKSIVRAYLAALKTKGLEIPMDAYEQLKESVKAVYRSWYGQRAVQFRRAMEVSLHWGTSVTLMEMVSGNQTGSGASVFFTRIPLSMEKGVFGETREAATGDDLVYGRLLNRPLSRLQAGEGQRSLEEVDPGLFEQHKRLAAGIEQAMRNLPQEVEVTYIKRPDGERLIYVLQTRRMEFSRGFTKRFEDVCNMEEAIIGRGIGVYGGALSGVATFSSSPETLKKLRIERSLPLILLRKSASTDDVSLMPEISGIITAMGGATSHAAILAQKFGLTAVVGCSDMHILDDNGNLSARIGNYIITEGTTISIDGSTGLVYSELCMPTLQSEADEARRPDAHP